MYRAVDMSKSPKELERADTHSGVCDNRAKYSTGTANILLYVLAGASPTYSPPNE
jgi:hypothetical protein